MISPCASECGSTSAPSARTPLPVLSRDMNLVERPVPYELVLGDPRNRAIALDNQRFNRADPDVVDGQTVVAARGFWMRGSAAWNPVNHLASGKVANDYQPTRPRRPARPRLIGRHRAVERLQANAAAARGSAHSGRHFTKTVGAPGLI